MYLTWCKIQASNVTSGCGIFQYKYILGLQPRDKAAMLVVKTKEIFLLNLHQNRVHFPEERNAFVLDHQHGRRDVTCKPAIVMYLLLKAFKTLKTTNECIGSDGTYFLLTIKTFF